jgi:ABC-type xylose transport system permease subunit
VATAAPARAPVGSTLLGRLVGTQEAVLLACILLLLAAVGAANPRFLAQNNLQSIFLGNAYIAVAAIGMSLVIISGNIDVSVGSLIGVLATLSGTLAVNRLPSMVMSAAVRGVVTPATMLLNSPVPSGLTRGVPTPWSPTL